jgi:hypothetical protein
MTVEDIFTNITKHQVKGLMIHNDLANYYDFLGLAGYKRCHEYHFLDEIGAFRRVNRYYINHYSKLIPPVQFEPTEVISGSWYKYTRQEVDASTKKNSVERGLKLWVEWEKETKRLYEDMYKELMTLDEVAAALMVKELVCDVDCELKYAERYQLNKKAVNYDLAYVIGEQDCMHDRYKEKMKRIKF